MLGDHPSIAPESAGDLFDATEIDEILTLRVMTMTERGEGRGARDRPAGGRDPRRCDAMTDEAMVALHGVRVRPVDEVPWWDEAAGTPPPSRSGTPC